jgi:hypothetical protein
MTIRDYTKGEALAEMQACRIIASNCKYLSGLDRRRNAECYVLARDRAIALGADINNYPRSIGETEPQFSQLKLPEIFRRIF